MAKVFRLSNDLGTLVNAYIIGGTSSRSQIPFHHAQQKRLLELEAPNWKEWALTNGSCIINYKQTKWISVYWRWNLPPSTQ